MAIGVWYNHSVTSGALWQVWQIQQIKHLSSRSNYNPLRLIGQVLGFGEKIWHFLKLAVKSDSTEMFVIMSEYPQKRDHTSPNKWNVVFFPFWLFLGGVLKESLSGSTRPDWIRNPFLFTVGEKISSKISQGSFMALTCDTSLKIKYEDSPIPVLWIYFWKEFMEYSYNESQRDALFIRFIW